MPVGVASVGRWHYAFIYDIVPRYLPDLMEAARPISEKQARSTLLEKYFLSLGAARQTDINKLFKWRSEDTLSTIESLIKKCAITDTIDLSDSKEKWLVLSDLT
jgi:uncharacterized protein YcaQ